MRGFGHGLQLLLLQVGVLRRHRLSQPVDTKSTEDRVRRHILVLSMLHSVPQEKRSASSLDVLLMSWARHRLGPPALLLLRYVILENKKRKFSGRSKKCRRGEWRMWSGVRRSERGYLKVWVGLPVVPVIIYSCFDRLSCCCLPHV